MNDKQQQVLEILSGVVEKPAAELKPEHKLKDDLELDSTQGMELLANLEDEFDLDIDEAQAAKLERIGDLLALVGGGEG